MIKEIITLDLKKQTTIYLSLIQRLENIESLMKLIPHFFLIV